jgi:hypothetical protein
MQGRIIPFGDDLFIRIPQNSLLSWDFDGTLARFVRHDKEGRWFERGYAVVTRRLRQMAKRGHRNIIVTHRAKQLEGNPIFYRPEYRGLTIQNLVESLDLPVQDVIFTAQGDKGSLLRQMGAFMHYDDQNDNLEAVARHGIIGVRVDPGPQPPKMKVKGDGQNAPDAIEPVTV